MKGFKAIALGLLASALLTGCMSRDDAIAPIVTIYDPPAGAVRRVVDSRVCGYAMDDEGVASIRVGNSELLSNEAYQSERNKSLIEFCFRIVQQSADVFASTIVVEDTSGRSTTLNYELQLDTTPPTLELREVTQLSGDRLRVSGLARDNDLVKSITVAGQSVPFVAVAEKEFSLDIPAGGDLTIVVEDRAGNTYSQPLTPQ